MYTIVSPNHTCQQHACHKECFSNYVRLDIAGMQCKHVLVYPFHGVWYVLVSIKVQHTAYASGLVESHSTFHIVPVLHEYVTQILLMDMIII